MKKGEFSFPTKKEDGIEFSSAAKSFINRMLCLDEAKRSPAKELLNDPFLTKAASRPTVNVSPKVVANLKNFHGKQRFKKLALTAIASQMTGKEIEELKQTFLGLDTNRDGTLTLEEMK